MAPMMIKKPRSPISAYNIFFQDERQRLLGMANGKRPNFRNLAKYVASKWKAMNDSDRVEYVQRAYDDKKRYALELVEWHRQQEFLVGDDTNGAIIMEEAMFNKKSKEQTDTNNLNTTCSDGDMHQPIPFHPTMFHVDDAVQQGYVPELYHLPSNNATMTATSEWMPVGTQPTQVAPYVVFPGYQRNDRTTCVIPSSPSRDAVVNSSPGSLDWVAHELGRDGVRFLINRFAHQDGAGEKI